MAMKVLISDAISQECIDILRQNDTLTVDINTGLTPDALKKIIGDYHGIVIRSATKLTADVLEKATSLKVIGRAGSGLDNVDKDVATAMGIIVMNTPGGNTVSTAEHAYSMLLSLSRNIPQAYRSMAEGKWEKKQFKGVEVYNKTLGIIGLGKIGREVALRALGFGMRVLAFDPFVTKEVAAKDNITLASLEEIYINADYITIHTPMTEKTRHMISDAEFKIMKDGVRIINCARGGIVDEAALLTALNNGKCAGAALDVFEVEPPTDNPLTKLPNVIYTPHLGASTAEAQVSVAVAIAEQIYDVLINNTIRNAVNAPSLDGEMYQQIKPSMDLGEKIGLLQAQLSEGQIKSISVKYSGQVCEFDTATITTATIKGLLSPSMQEDVNYINARVVAQGRGIKISESHEELCDDFHTKISVTVTTDKGEKIIDGSVFGKTDIRIIQIDAFHVDTIPHGLMLISENKDVPGTIGKLGSIMGENGINITNMSWGSSNNKVMMALNVNKQVPADILAALNQDKDFNWTKVVDLG